MYKPQKHTLFGKMDSGSAYTKECKDSKPLHVIFSPQMVTLCQITCKYMTTKINKFPAQTTNQNQLDVHKRQSSS